MASAKTCSERLAPPYGVMRLGSSVHQFSTGFLYMMVLCIQSTDKHRQEINWPQPPVVYIDNYVSDRAPVDYQ